MRAEFGDAVFDGAVGLAEAEFAHDASFARSSLRAAQRFGPFVCRGTVDLSHAVFGAPVTLEITADRVSCVRTHWEATATLRLRRAALDLSDAVLLQPVAVTARPVPFDVTRTHDGAGGPYGEASGEWARDRVGVVSLRGVDCAMLTLADVDLTECRFAGAFHLDHVRFEGLWTFGSPPRRGTWRRGIPYSWTQRQVLEEERQWRTLPDRPAALRRGWGTPPPSPHDVPGLATLTTVYRQLRKAREDAKDEPGAADFYYGEMEMRRHSFSWRSAERWLLQTYWLLSGYGLRASRALGWLALALTATVVLMMAFGLPAASPKQRATGHVPPGGGKVTFTIDKAGPENPTGDRFTTERFEKALGVTLNSVVFRSSGQDLTTAGTYIEMVSRFTEPVLLGLAVLAVRGRVKR